MTLKNCLIKKNKKLFVFNLENKKEEDFKKEIIYIVVIVFQISI
jgi:hypothetical protein